MSASLTRTRGQLTIRVCHSWFRADKKCLQLYEGGGSPILTNAFLEQTMNNLENLSDTKVLYVTKDCLRNLARTKNATRAQKLDFWRNSFYLPPIFRNCVPTPNQACRGAPNSLNRDPFQYLTPKHDVHTSGTLRAGFADF